MPIVIATSAARPRGWRHILAAAALSALAACAPQADPQTVHGFRSAVATGNFQAAHQIAATMAQPGERPELMWSLNAGAAALHAGDYAAAVRHFDNAEALMRASEEASFNWGSTYRFGTYDAVMVNTYKALAQLGLRDPDAARVELNRMEERQARTVQRFEREISEARAAREQGLQDASRAQALRNAEAAPEVRQQLAALDEFRNVQPFVNPAGNYLRAVYLMNTRAPGDAGQARDVLGRVAVISNRPRVVMEDLNVAERLNRGQRGAPQVWILFENGQSPLFEQMNFTVPMPVLARGGGVTVRPVTVSMPRMVFQPAAYPSLEASGGNARANTELVASVAGVMASEFRTRYDGLLAAAVFEALAKAAGISAANALGGQMGGWGVLLDIAATAAANITSSDTRSWALLPREFQAARLPVPADGRVTIRAAGGPQESVAVPTDRSSLVVVKAQGPGSPLTIQVTPL